MDDLKRRILVLDNAGRDLVSLTSGEGNREWRWAAADGALVALAGRLTAIGGAEYEFIGEAPDLKSYNGRKGTEADLLSEIGTDLGWHMPVQPVEMPGGVSLTR